MTVNCYTDVKTLDEIRDHWLSELGLPVSCLRGFTVDVRPACTQRKRNGLLPYGTCRLRVGSVSIIQRICGSIQEYGGFSKSEW